MVFHWGLSDKSHQVSKTHIFILAVLNNVVLGMVSTRPPTSKSSSSFSNPLVTVPNAPITIGIIVTSIFHCFFNSLARSRYLSFISHYFSFFYGQPGQQSRQFCKFSFFKLLSGLVLIRWSVCKSKFHRSLCVLFSMTCAGLRIYHLFLWSNLNFSNISQWITLPIQSCLVLYSFCAYLLHSLMCLMVSSLSLHSVHLLFFCVLSILPLTQRLECSPMARETWVQSQVESYQRL